MTGKPRSGVAKGGQGGRGAKAGSHRKGAALGSGGQGKQKLEGKKPTPPGELRKGHPKARKAAAAAKRTATGASGSTRSASGPTRSAPARSGGAPARSSGAPGTRLPKASGISRKASPDMPETVSGRNPVVESLRAKVPAMALYVALGNDNDERMTEAIAAAIHLQRSLALCWRMGLGEDHPRIQAITTALARVTPTGGDSAE